MGWTDVCRAKNGGMKCDSADACQACKDEAALKRTSKCKDIDGGDSARPTLEANIARKALEETQ